jgi:HPt (histidine-containing phosphotransfer) domain-containing protein
MSKQPVPAGVTDAPPSSSSFASALDRSIEEFTAAAVKRHTWMAPEDIREAMQSFIAQLVQDRAAFIVCRDALESSDNLKAILEDLRFRSHRLRSPCAILGLTLLAQRMGDLEHATRTALLKDGADMTAAVRSTLAMTLEALPVFD